MYGDGYKYYSKVCRDGRDEEGQTACERCKHNQTCDKRMPVVTGDAVDAWKLSTWSPSVWVYGFNGIVGFDYAQIRAVADILGIRMTASMMDMLKVIEKERLDAVEKTRETKDNG